MIQTNLQRPSMSTAAELLDPEVLASIKAEFHDVFIQKKEEIHKLRAAVRPLHSALDEYQVASEDGTLAGIKRSREGTERLIRPLKRPRIIEDLSKTSSGAMKEPCYRDLWENHTFAELSPTGALQAVRKVHVREELYGALRVWKEVERGMAVYEYVFAQDYDPHAQVILIVSMDAIDFVKLIASGPAISGALCLIVMKRLPLKR